MCDPVSIAAVSTAVAGVSTAYSQVQQGKFQKGVADYNARVAENEAQASRNAGTEQEIAQRQRTAQLLSTQRAQLGASNVELGSGSALQLQEDTITLGEADALRIRGNSDRRFEALQTQADLTRQQGEFAEKAGRNAAVGTLLGTAGSVMGTGVADKWFSPTSAALQSTGEALQFQELN